MKRKRLNKLSAEARTPSMKVEAEVATPSSTPRLTPQTWCQPTRKSRRLEMKIKIETPQREILSPIQPSQTLPSHMTKIRVKEKISPVLMKEHKEPVENTDSESDPEVTTESDYKMDTSPSSSGTGGMSDYEKLRLENMKRNEEMLRSLNIHQFVDDLKLSTQTRRLKPTSLSFTPRQKERVDLTPTRRSSRIQMKSENQTLQTQFYTPVIEKRERERHPPGPIDMDPFNDIENTDSQAFLNGLAISKVKPEQSSETETVETYKEKISKLSVLPKNVAKIVPSKILSLAFHPTSTRPILCAGDRFGSIGFWDINANRETNNGIYIYNPHAQGVTMLGFQPHNENKLYSSSYDGTVRCGDFSSCVFNEVYSVPFNEDIGFTSLSHQSPDVVLVSRTDGQISVIDTRSSEKASVHLCHRRAVRCVSCCPTDSNLISTSSADASVALWDLRRMKNMNSKLDFVQLGRSVSSAYFSPVTGGQILATSFDDSVVLFDVSLESRKLIKTQTFKHYNQTGRWLTPFKATWDPKNERGFVVGNMKHPRKVDIFHSEQKLNSPVIELIDENFATITSINAFHPNRNMLACGNSSGKVYIWSENGN